MAGYLPYIDFEISGTSARGMVTGSRNLESMKNSLQDMEQRLRTQRQMKSRPNELEEMDSDQVITF